MKIEQLRYIVEIAKTSSINQAAANLYLSQPNLSLSIRMLEDELGCVLIKRTRRGVTLTPEGQDFVENARSIIEQFDHLRTIGQTARNKHMECLSVASMRFRFLNVAAAEMYNRHQDQPFQLLLREFSRDGVLKAVADGHSEIGFIHILSCYKKDVLNQIRSRDLIFTDLSIDDVAILVGPRNPLFHQTEDTVSVEDLAPYPFICYEEMDHYHYSDRAWLIGVRPSAGEIVVNGKEELNTFLEYTNAFAVGSYNDQHYSNLPYQARLRSLRIRDCDLSLNFGVVTRKDHGLSALAREFIDSLLPTENR